MNGIRSMLMKGAVAVAAAILAVGCSSESVINETVATVDGSRITIMEVREVIGIPGGIVSASMLTPEQKRKAVDQIVETRLLAQEARSLGLDNTPEFRDAIRTGERGLLVKGLFRKELEKKGKKAEAEIESAAKELMAKDNSLKPNDAKLQAGQNVVADKLNRIQEALIADARKAFPERIDEAAIARVSKEEGAADNTVLGQVGDSKVTYGEAKRMVGSAMAGSRHAGRDFSKDPNALKSVVGQELTNLALYSYAKQQGVEKGDWMELDRISLEQSVLVSLLADKVIFKDIAVTDKDIEATYAEHKDMFAKEGKAIPLAEVRGQIVEFLTNDKKRKAVEAFLVPLKSKAKVSVVEKVLSKV